MLAAIRVSSLGTARKNHITYQWLTLSLWGRQRYCSPLCAQDRDATVAVIGGGAAGLTAAYFAALKLNETKDANNTKSQGRVLVLERTKEAGKKVLMSGGSRCNVLPTEVDIEKDFHTDSSKSALRAIFASWGVWQCWSWLSEAKHVGLELSLEEESNKWFPTSNSSREVRDKLVKACSALSVNLMWSWTAETSEWQPVSTVASLTGVLTVMLLCCGMWYQQRHLTVPSHRRLGVIFMYNSRVTGLKAGRQPDVQQWSVDLADGTQVSCDSVVIATGGLSFPQVGTDGSGHQILEQLGHKMVDPYPALTPLVGEHPKGKEHERIPGVSVNVSASMSFGKRKVEAPRTGFLFTHKGFSGPAVLDLSHHFVRSTQEFLAAPVGAPADKPKLLVNWTNRTQEEWFNIFRDRENRAVNAVTMIKKDLPSRLAQNLYEGAVAYGMPKKCANVSRKEATRLAEALSAYEVCVTGHQGYKMAEVTGGGVKLEELNCKTMESVHYPSLHLCGEVCDVFGRIGGFNFYWAWVSGRAAGLAAAGSDWTKCDV